MTLPLRSALWHFNPRARVGRDTFWRLRRRTPTRISIHAPAWGATFGNRFPKPLNQYFNPRARVGRDKLVDVFLRPLQISIHAPAWGATG